MFSEFYNLPCAYLQFFINNFAFPAPAQKSAVCYNFCYPVRFKLFFYFLEVSGWVLFFFFFWKDVLLFPSLFNVSLNKQSCIKVYFPNLFSNNAKISKEQESAESSVWETCFLVFTALYLPIVNFISSIMFTHWIW